MVIGGPCVKGRAVDAGARGGASSTHLTVGSHPSTVSWLASGGRERGPSVADDQHQTRGRICRIAAEFIAPIGFARVSIREILARGIPLSQRLRQVIAVRSRSPPSAPSCFASTWESSVTSIATPRLRGTFATGLSAIGVALGLWVTGTTLDVMAMVGMLVLVGIVVNNGIVLVDSVNQLRRDEGMDVFQGAFEGGKTRMRPVLMTALATIFGMLPHCQ
jgi:hypothetical protein